MQGVVRLEGRKGPREGPKVAQNALKLTSFFRILKFTAIAAGSAAVGRAVRWSRRGSNEVQVLSEPGISCAFLYFFILLQNHGS